MQEDHKMWGSNQMISPKQVQDIWDSYAKGLAAVDRYNAIKIIKWVEVITNTKDSNVSAQSWYSRQVDKILETWQRQSNPEEVTNLAPFQFKVGLIQVTHLLDPDVSPKFLNFQPQQPFQGSNREKGSKVERSLVDRRA
jgi:hypothetical protein